MSHAECQRRYATKKRRENGDEVREYELNYLNEHRDKIHEQRRKRKDVLKRLVIDAYGGKCACCGETNPVFLTMDHVNGGGTEHRRSHPGLSGANLYRWLKKNGFPETFQVLCFNCNCGRQINGGVCPHQEKIDGHE